MIKHNKTKRRFGMPPMLFVLLGFLAVMLIGAFLLCLPISSTDGEWMSFTNAIFWAANSVCGTGLIVTPPALSLTGFGQAILFLLFQFGGLGFMTFATFVFMLIRKRITLKDRIAISEALGQDQMKGVVRLVRNIAITTAVIELSGAILLIPFFTYDNGAIGIWQALFTSVSAFCTTGFDIMGSASSPNGSMTVYSSTPGVLLIISTLAILGALGFPVISDIIKNKFRWRRYRLHTKLVLIMTATLVIVGTFVFLGSEFNSEAFSGMNGGEKLLNSLFQSVMASSTAGFFSVKQSALSSTGKTFTCFLMFIGASPCSTGGGIKSTTFAILVIMGVAGLRGKDELVIGKRSISLKTGMRAVAVVLVAVTFIIIGSLIITATDPAIPAGYDVYEAISAFTTAGLNVGTVPIYSTGTMYVFMILMFIGRLGPLSIGMIFTKRDNTSLKYPSASIMIG